MKVKKKPVVVEAKCFNSHDLLSQEELATWCGGKLCGTALPFQDRVIRIETLEGEMEASYGDWIIRGVQGEHYPCKPEIFALTYETADE